MFTLYTYITHTHKLVPKQTKMHLFSPAQERKPYHTNALPHLTGAKCTAEVKNILIPKY